MSVFVWTLSSIGRLKNMILNIIKATALIAFLALSWDAAANTRAFETTHEKLCRENKHYRAKQGDLCDIKITKDNIETLIRLQPYKG